MQCVFAEGRGVGWLEREGRLNKFLLLKRDGGGEGGEGVGGFFESGGFIEDIQ